MKKIKSFYPFPSLEKFILPLIICVLGVLVYSNSLQVPFQFDDNLFVVNNPTIRDIHRVDQIFKGLLQQRSRFVAFYTFAINYHFSGIKPFGYHVTNLAIHLFCAMLVGILVSLLLRTKVVSNQHKSDRLKYLPMMSSLLFLVHPVQTQAVVYITQRFASLATMFYLLALCFYLNAKFSHKRVALRCASWIGFFSATLLGMFTKEITITIPIMVLMMEAYFFNGGTSFKKLLLSYKEKNKWIVFLLIASLLLIIPKLFGFTITNQLFSPKASNAHDGDVITFGKYVATQFRVFLTFVRLLFVPLFQNVDYDFPLSKSLFELKAFCSFIAFVLLFWVGLFFKKKNVLISFGIMWMFLAFIPNFIPRADVIFEHKLYLISVGFCLAVSVVFLKSIKNIKLVGTVFCVLLLVLSMMTYRRNIVWGSELSLWTDAAKKSPKKSRALNNAGFAHLKRKEYREAFDYFSRVINTYPRFVRSYDNRGTVYHEWKQYDKALNDFNKAITINPRFARAYYNRGNLFRDLKKYDRAISDFTKAIELQKNYTLAYNNRGNTYSYMGKYFLAIDDFNTVVKLSPGFDKVYNNRGAVYIATKQYDLALQDLNKMIALKPQRAKAYYNRSYLHRIKGEYGKAFEDAMKAKSLGQNISEVHLKDLKKLAEN